jgi:hypothetical protein
MSIKFWLLVDLRFICNPEGRVSIFILGLVAHRRKASGNHRYFREGIISTTYMDWSAILGSR